MAFQYFFDFLPKTTFVKFANQSLKTILQIFHSRLTLRVFIGKSEEWKKTKKKLEKDVSVVCCLKALKGNSTN